MNDKIGKIIDRRLAGVQADEALLKRIARRAQEEAPRKKRGRPVVLLAALIALLLLTGAAFASGVAQSIFAALAGRYGPEDDVLYAQMDLLSTKDEWTESLSDIPGAELTLYQSYYDGAQLALAFSLEWGIPADLSFGPGHPMFQRLQSTRSDGSTLVIDLKQRLTNQEYQAFTQALEDKGEAGVIFYPIVAGDDVFLQDGGELMIADSDVLPEGHLYRLYDELPPAARNQTALDLSLAVYAQPTYYYEDGEGAYWASGDEVCQRVSLHVARGAGEAVVREVSVNGPNYRGQASVTCSPIGVSYKLLLQLPERWIADWYDESSDKEDRILNFHVVNGEQVIEQTVFSESLYDGNQMELEGRCAADTSGASEIRLRPVYRHSGPRAAEDIVVPLDNH